LFFIVAFLLFITQFWLKYITKGRKMFLNMAKNFTWGNNVYSPFTITNENEKGKPFFSYSVILSSTALLKGEKRATFATH